MKALGVIPARWGSTRFPGKPLQLVSGRPLLEWVIEGARVSRLLDEILVATDDGRIASLAEKCGVRSVMTESDLPTGTDRVFQAIQRCYANDLSSDDVVVNIQGDEPLIVGEVLDRLVEPFRFDSGLEMATLGKELDLEALRSQNTAKIVLNQKGEALYFSRLPIPYTRVEPGEPLSAALKHIGIYAYRCGFLRRFCEQKPTELERMESLEQLRALYLGARIKVIRVVHESWGVDTPDDVKKIEQILNERDKSIQQTGRRE